MQKQQRRNFGKTSQAAFNRHRFLAIELFEHLRFAAAEFNLLRSRFSIIAACRRT